MLVIFWICYWLVAHHDLDICARHTFDVHVSYVLLSSCAVNKYSMTYFILHSADCYFRRKQLFSYATTDLVRRFSMSTTK